MCGIWLLLTKLERFRFVKDKFSDDFMKKLSFNFVKDNFFIDFMKLKHRGPDNTYYKIHNDHGLIMGFHRLAINGIRVNSDQPFVLETETSNIYCICNGEIYNYKQMAKKYDIVLTSGSDCDILIHLYLKIGIESMLKEIDGEFAMIICENSKTTNEVKLFVCRDQCGIRPLFVAWDENTIIFSSELKGCSISSNVQQFPPRTYLTLSSGDNFDNIKFTSYMSFDNIPQTINDFEEAKKIIREEFITSVESRLMADREYGCLLSGGLDSSLVAAITSKKCKENGKILKTFCIGMDEHATDIKYAELVAKHIGSHHTTIIYPETEWLYVIDTVIHAIESYDITTARASIGQYLVSRWISEYTNIKVLLIGDGSDELTGGYIYTLKAPSKDDFHQEILRLLNNIHFFDVLRSDRGISSNGLEARVPFLSRKFIETYLSISTDLRKPPEGVMEKYLLRSAFEGTNLLPDEILWRKKEAFSDGCSTIERSWFRILQDNMETRMYDKEFKIYQKQYKHCTPPSKEAVTYRIMFESHFGKDEIVSKVIPYFWLPKWCGNISEPSARILTDLYNTK